MQAREWSSVRLIGADATTFDPTHVANELPAASRGRVDGAFSSYAMSVFDDWHPAWDRMRSRLRLGGRACIVDMQLPVGSARLFRPLVRWATAVGGADLQNRLWTAIERDGVNVQVLICTGRTHSCRGRNDPLTRDLTGGPLAFVLATIMATVRMPGRRWVAGRMGVAYVVGIRT